MKLKYSKLKTFFSLAAVYFSVVIFAVPNAGADTTTGLVGWWELDEVAGITAFDSSGRGHVGTLLASPSWVAGKFNNALSFDGSSTYVTVPASADFDNTGDFTISAWVYSTDTSNSSARRSVFGRSMGNLWHLITLEQVYRSTGTTFDFEYVTRTEAGQSAVRSIGPVFTANAWHHVAGVKNGSTVTIWVDGVAGTLATNPRPDPIDLAAVDVAIGSRRAAVADDIWAGYIDDVRFYNRALSSADVAELYNGTSDTTAPGAPTGLIVQ